MTAMLGLSCCASLTAVLPLEASAQTSHPGCDSSMVCTPLLTASWSSTSNMRIKTPPFQVNRSKGFLVPIPHFHGGATPSHSAPGPANQVNYVFCHSVSVRDRASDRGQAPLLFVFLFSLAPTKVMRQMPGA